MRKKINSIIISFVFVFMAFFAAGNHVLAQSEGLNSAMSGLGETAGTTFKKDVTVNSLVGTIITAVLSILGVIFLVIMIYGGFLWMTARGDESQVTKAKDLMQAAIIGVAVVLAAYAISIYVILKLSENTLNEV